MNKKVIINSCNQCLYCDLGAALMAGYVPAKCRHDHNEKLLPEDLSVIPEWCPLEDAD